MSLVPPAENPSRDCRYSPAAPEHRAASAGFGVSPCAKVRGRDNEASSQGMVEGRSKLGGCGTPFTRGILKCASFARAKGAT